MKILNIIITVVCVLGIAASGMSFEGNGSDMPKVINGNGAGDGTGPIHDILSGEEVTISGTVYHIGPYGEGLQIDTGNEETEDIVTVYGIGPLRYWDSLEIDHPIVGDAVTVNGMTIAFSDGSTKTVAMSIIIGDDTIQLRDNETGLPLWRQNPQKRGGMMKQENMKGFRNQNCPAVDVDSEGV